MLGTRTTFAIAIVGLGVLWYFGGGECRSYVPVKIGNMLVGSVCTR